MSRGRGIVSLLTGASASPSQKPVTQQSTLDPIHPTWDPMKEDFTNREFNSYDMGPGRDMRGSRSMEDVKKGDKDFVELYVTGIPMDFTEDDLTHLFNRAGKVLRVRKMQPKPGIGDGSTTFGFVKYAKTDEAYEAIKEFDNFKMGKSKLRVKVTLSDEEKKRRAQEKMEIENHERYLEESRKLVAKSMAEEKAQQNGQASGYDSTGFDSKPLSRSPVTAGSARGRCGRGGESPSPSPSHASARVVSPMGFSSHAVSPRGRSGTPSSSYIPKNVNVTKKTATKKPCFVCGKLAGTRCPRCKVPYCSVECQTKDWNENRHSQTCQERSSYEVELEDRFVVDVDEDHIAKIKKELGAKAGHMPVEVLNERSPCEVYVSHVVHPGDLYVIKAEYAEALQALRRQMDQHYEHTNNVGPNSYLPRVHDYCAGQYTVDNCWFRARVDSINLDGTMAVTYVDYGNSEEILATRVRKLSDKFTQLPIQAIHVNLPISPCGAGPWLADTLTLWTTIIQLDKTYNVEMYDRNNHIPVIIMNSKNGLDIGHFLVKHGNASWTKHGPSPMTVTQGQPGSSVSEKCGLPGVLNTPTPQETLPPHRTDSAETPPPHQTLPQQTPTQTTPPLRVKTPTECAPGLKSGPDPVIPKSELPTVAKYITKEMRITIKALDLDSPSQFWVHVLNPEYMADLLELQKQLGVHYSQLKVKRSGFVPNGYMLYAAKYTADDEWYRAMVYEYNTREAKVQYLDYGNRETISFTRLHPLEGQHCSLAFQAVQCCLSEVGPTGEHWSQEEKVYFAQSVANRDLLATVVEKYDHILVLDIILPTGSSLSNKLIQEGYAKPQKNMDTVSSSVPKVVEQLPREQTEVKTRHDSVQSSSSSQGKKSPVNYESVRPKSPRDYGSAKPLSPASQGEGVVKKLNRVDDIPKALLPKSEVISVKINDAPEPGDLTLQVMEGDLLQAAIDLHNNMPKFYPENAQGGYQPQKGELVCALYEDNAWYRAEVKNIVSGDIAVVKFIDYGNLETVKFDKILPLVPELMTSPCLGISAQLGEFVVDEGKQWDPNCLLSHINLFMTVKDTTCSKLTIIDLINPVSNTSVIEELVNSGLIIEAAKIKKSSSSPTSAEHSRISTQSQYQAVSTSLCSPQEPTGPSAPVMPCPVEEDECATLASIKTFCLQREEPYRVLVSDAASPDRFTIQIIDEEVIKSLQTMEAELAEMAKTFTGNHHPKKGEIVCAKFHLDQAWYRAEVLDVSGENVHVRFIDYGNCESVKPADVNKLPAKLMGYQVHGVLCKFYGSSGMAESTKWDPNLMLSKHFMCRALSRKEGVYGVRLWEMGDDGSVSMEEGSSVNEVLLEAGIFVPAEPAQKAQSSAKAQTQTPKEPKKNIILAKSIPVVSLDPADNQVMACQVTGPHEFYVQKVDLVMIEKFIGMTKALQEYGDVPRYQPEVGEIVRVQYEFGGEFLWYRGSVLGVRKVEILALLVDYGNMAVVPVEQVTALKETHAELPKQAVRCSLFGTTEAENRWSGAAIMKLSQLIMDCQSSLTIQDRDEETETFNVSEITVLDTGLKVVETMLKEKWMNLPERVMKGLTETKPDIARITDIPVQHLPETKIRVLLASVTSPEEFYLQVVENWCQDKLVEMLKHNQAFCKSVPDAYTPVEIGEVVFGVYEKGWYRAEVLKLPVSNKVELRFIDFGNCDLVDLSEVRRLPSEEVYTKLPQQAIPCKFADSVKGTGPNGAWTDKACAWLKKTGENSVYELRMIDSKMVPHRVDLYAPQVGNLLSQAMVDEGHAVLSSQSSPEIPRPQRVNTPPPLQKAVYSGPRFQLEQLPDTNVPKETTLVVADVKNPGLFACQQVTAQVAEGLTKVAEGIKSHCDKTCYDPTFLPGPQELCCASHADGELYRAVVTGRDGEGYQVTYLDFGDSATVNPTALRPFAASLLSDAPYSFQCSLAGIEPVGPSWQPKAIEKFHALTDSKRLLAQVGDVDKQTNIYSVTLIVENGEDVVASLVSEGLAIRSGGSGEPDTTPAPAVEITLEEQVKLLLAENQKLKAMLEKQNK